MTDSNMLKDLAESFKPPTAKWPNHQVVLDLWTRRDEIDKLVQLLDVAAEWEYVDDGANIPYYKLQSEKSPVFAMLVAGSRTSMLWRLSVDPNTQQLTQVSDNLVFGKPDKIMGDAKATVRASLVASRAAFDSIANWLILATREKELAGEKPSSQVEAPTEKQEGASQITANYLMELHMELSRAGWQHAGNGSPNDWELHDDTGTVWAKLHHLDRNNHEWRIRTISAETGEKTWLEPRRTPGVSPGAFEEARKAVLIELQHECLKVRGLK
jgi:hypothetical protein